MSNRRLLVVLAHPDDESFPMGGTLAKYASEGVHITLVCATRGEAGIPYMSAKMAGHVRERELRCAAAELGLSDVRFLGYPDGGLNTADPEAVTNDLIRIMEETPPQVVITFGPDGISGHPDHIAIHQLTTRAFDRFRLASCLYYIAPSEATLQGCGVEGVGMLTHRPTVGVDVSEHLLAKVRAMQCHASQNPPYPGPPEEEAARLACHEYFTLARPLLSDSHLTDLFAAVSLAASQK